MRRLATALVRTACRLAPEQPRCHVCAGGAPPLGMRDLIAGSAPATAAATAAGGGIAAASGIGSMTRTAEAAGASGTSAAAHSCSHCLFFTCSPRFACSVTPLICGACLLHWGDTLAMPAPAPCLPTLGRLLQPSCPRQARAESTLWSAPVSLLHELRCPRCKLLRLQSLRH